jgi:hypothetical protein
MKTKMAKPSIAICIFSTLWSLNKVSMGVWALWITRQMHIRVRFSELGPCQGLGIVSDRAKDYIKMVITCTWILDDI